MVYDSLRATIAYETSSCCTCNSTKYYRWYLECFFSDEHSDYGLNASSFYSVYQMTCNIKTALIVLRSRNKCYLEHEALIYCINWAWCYHMLDAVGYFLPSNFANKKLMWKNLHGPMQDWKILNSPHNPPFNLTRNIRYSPNPDPNQA